MNDVVVAICIGGTLLAAAVYAVSAARGQRPMQWHLWLAMAVEGLLLALAIVAGIGLAQGELDGSATTFLLYLLVTVALLPLGVLWAMAEPSRWSVAVLAGVCLTLAVLVVRLDQVWAGV